MTVTATDQPTGGSTVGTIVGSPLTFNGNENAKTVQFDPATAGTSLIRVETPATFSTPTTSQTITATVTAPAINFNGPTVGKDLQVTGSLSLDAGAPGAGFGVLLTSQDPTKVLLSTSATALGSAQITLPFNNGSSSPSTSFFIQALDNTGTVQVIASAPGFVTQTATVTLTPSGFLINPGFIGNFTTTTFSPNTSVQIVAIRLNANLTNAGFQVLRGGLAPVSVTVTATDQPTGGSSVGTIVGSPLTFNGNENAKTVQFNPAAAGTSLIQLATPATFSTPATNQAITATVTAPRIQISGGSFEVGRDLQQSVSIQLAEAPPSPVTVTLQVASAAIATVVTAANATQAGGDTLTFSNVTSAFVGSIFVQGRTSSGTTTLTAQVPGYSDAVVTITTRPSGFVINTSQNGDFTTTTAAANTAISLQSARLDPVTLNLSQAQAVRGGVTVAVPVTTINQTPGGPAVGTIAKSPVTFGANVSTVFAPNTAEFDPAVAGVATITVGVPTGFDTPSNRRQITATVNP